MADRTPQNAGFGPLKDIVEDLESLSIQGYKLMTGEHNSLILALYNAKLRKDSLVRIVDEEGKFSDGKYEKEREITHIYMLILADELKVAGFNYNPEDR